MSGHDKRVLPTSATTTSALIPITPGALSGAAAGRAAASDDLIDQLVGGLSNVSSPVGAESRFYNHGGYNGQERIYSIDDEEIDEPPVPIPSTWREEGKADEPSWLAEQLRASAYGFVIGLFVVIPAVMLLTGQAERLPSWQAVSAYAKATSAKLGLPELVTGLSETQQAKPTDGRTASTPGASEHPTDQATLTTATGTQAQGSQTNASPPTTLQPHATPPDTTDPASASPSRSQGDQVAAMHAKPQDHGQAGTQDKVGQTQVLAEKGVTATGQEPAENAREHRVATFAHGSPATSPTPDAASTTRPVTTNSQTADAQPTASADSQPASSDTITRTRLAAVQTPAKSSSPQPVATPNQSQTGQTSGAAGTAVATKSGSADKSALGVFAQAPTIPLAFKVAQDGDMEKARVMLAKLASQGNSEAIFALAETFDPNVLAAKRMHGAEANTEKAKMFYSMALSQGVERAAARLQSLQ